ncbi:MAG: flagellar basal body P-ring formation chaperone FlgA [Planctomycetaceae bacterium]
MNNSKQFVVFVFAVSVAVPAGARIQIELRPDAAVESSEIRLGDIADIRGAAPRSVSTLQKLDIARLRVGQDSLSIRLSRVAIRLQLAGWSLQDFQVTGAPTVVVTRRIPEPVTDTAIEAAALDTMRKTFNVPSEELRVRLTSPFMTSLPRALQQDESLRLEVLPPLSSRIGAVPLIVRLLRDSRLVNSRTGRFEVLRLQKVAVTRTSMPRGHVIDDRDFQMESRFLAAPADQLDESQVVGSQVRTSLSAGAMISLRDLQPATKRQEVQIVRSRDNVQVTAFSGGFKVQLTAAQALQSGRRGDTIRVKNLKSNEILTGRVTGPGQIEIRL